MSSDFGGSTSELNPDKIEITKEDLERRFGSPAFAGSKTSSFDVESDEDEVGTSHHDTQRKAVGRYNIVEPQVPIQRAATICINGQLDTPDTSENNFVPTRRSKSTSDIKAQLRPVSTSSLSLDEEENGPVKFVEKPSKKLFCQLCGQVFRDPVIVSCGHTFCRRCVRDRQDKPCPVDKVAVSIVLANITIAEQIGELQVHCRFGLIMTDDGYEVDPAGCPSLIRLNGRKEHEESCDYAPITCPNNPQCPVLLKKDFEAHLKICKHATCHHARFGCGFTGTSDDLKRHLEEDCKFEGISGFLYKTEKEIQSLQTTIEQKDSEIIFLRNFLGKLSERVEMLERNQDLGCNDLGRLSLEVQEDRQNIATLQDDMDKIRSQMMSAGPVYDPQQMFKCKGTFVGHQGPVWCLCVHQDLLFSGSSDNTIKVWNTEQYKCLRTLEAHKGIVLALSTCANKLFSGSQDNKIIVWNLDNFEIIKSIDAHENPVCTLVAAKNMLFSGSLKVIKVWDVQSLQLKKEITGLNHWVRALVASHNRLYSGSYQTIKVWDLETLECVLNLDTSGGSVYSIAVTDRYILCGTYENRIHVWDLEEGQNQVKTLEGHSGIVYALAVLNTPSACKLFSGSYDHYIRVWSLENLVCTQTMRRHEGSVACLAVARGRLFSGAVDGMVKVWQ